MRQWLTDTLDFPGDAVAVPLIMLLATALAAIAGYYITRVLLNYVAILVDKSKTTWDDDLINTPLLKALSQLAPALIVAWLLPACFQKGNMLSSAISIFTSYYIIWVSVKAINTFLDNLLHAFAHRRRFKAYAVKGIFQMLKLIVIAIGLIIALSLLIGKTPTAILTALGASAAVLMLVFKDTILGLVASVQLTANKMVHKGDWIIVPKHNANGEVIDISLTTVKIRNWDNSVTTVPPYSLVSESFQNYQAMRLAQARRVSRSIYIDMKSIGFLEREEIERLHQSGMLPANVASEENRSINLSLFRDAMEHYISTHPRVRADLLHMVRQLPPSPDGLPVELYFFLRDTQWKDFEHIQSDIFDYIYAVLPHFRLAVYQHPAGTDLAPLNLRINATDPVYKGE